MEGHFLSGWVSHQSSYNPRGDGRFVPVDLVGTAIVFASGVSVSGIAAAIGSQLQKRRERQRRREQAAFEVFMLLLDLNSRYFWITSNEIHGEPPPPEIAIEVHRLAFRIADKLREADDIQHLKEILRVLMDEDAYATAVDRAAALDAVIKDIGDTVNPRYAKAIRDISASNIRGFVARPSNHRNNAPGTLR